MSTTTTETKAVVTAGSRRGSGPKAPPVRPEGKAAPAFYWMVVPALLLFAFFHTLPVLVGIFFSFTNYPGFGTWDFVGFANYANLFRDDRVLAAYGFSFGFAIA